MTALSPEQRNLVASLSQRLGEIRRVQAVALGGSHARGRARPESDIDLYIYYADATPFAIQNIRELAETVNDSAGPVVTDFYGWGPWVKRSLPSASTSLNSFASIVSLLGALAPANTAKPTEIRSNRLTIPRRQFCCSRRSTRSTVAKSGLAWIIGSP